MTILAVDIEHKALVICRCGVEKTLDVHRIVRGRVKSCGCQQAKLLESNNLLGQRFNSWIVKSYIGRINGQSTYWLCQCDCGTEKPVKGFFLLNDKSKSCGCQFEKNFKESRQKRLDR